MIYLDLALVIFSGAGFCFGALKYLKPKKPLYASMIVLGIGCVMIGRAYIFLRMLTGLETMGIFHVGLLGTLGAFAFFFSANYGQVDSLVDGGEPRFMKYRIIAFSGIAVICALYIFVLISPASLTEKVTDGVIAAMIAAASYYHVKHIVIPDVDYGVVNCIRGYNVLAFIYGILCMLEMIAAADRMNTMLIIVCAAECLVSLLIVPVMDRGVQKWNK